MRGSRGNVYFRGSSRSEAVPVADESPPSPDDLPIPFFKEEFLEDRAVQFHDGEAARPDVGVRISPRERISPTHSLDSGDANGGKLSPHRKKDPKDPPQFAPGTPTMRSAQQEQPSQPSFPCISPGPRPKAARPDVGVRQLRSKQKDSERISPRERISPTHSLDSGDANGGKLSPHRKKDPKDPPQFAPGTPTMRSAQQEQPSQPSFPCISPAPRPKAIPVTGAQRPLRDRTPTPFAKEIVACDDGNGVQFNDPVTTEVLPAPEYPDFAPGTPPTPHGAKPWILKMDPEGICGTSPSAIVPYNTEPEGSWRLQPGGGWRLQSAASNEASDRSTKTLEDLRSARAAQSAGPAAPVRVPEVYDMAEGEDIIARINFLEGQAEEQRINNEALQVEVNELRAMLMELMQSPQSS